MGQRIRFQAISVKVLALSLVMAIQGITPDARDLASLRGLYVLCQLPTPPDSSEDDTSEMEDDVCGPLGRAMNSELREHIERSARFELIATTPRVPFSAVGTFLSNMSQPLVPRGDDLARSPCRLIC